MSFTAEQLAGVYLKIRNKRQEIKKDWEEKDKALEAQMKVLEAQMLDLCQSQEVESLRTAKGTIIRGVQTRYWATDWKEFHDFILENSMPELLERRVSQGTIKEWIANNPDKMPPGVTSDSRYTITVRRPTSK